jgi:hypothetical protein
MINFFWATFFIFYDPLEFLTGACQTPTGQEMSIFHLCALLRLLCGREKYSFVMNQFINFFLIKVKKQDILFKKN